MSKEMGLCMVGKEIERGYGVLVREKEKEKEKESQR
jgi:hypothetical protein